MSKNESDALKGFKDSDPPNELAEAMENARQEVVQQPPTGVIVKCEPRILVIPRHHDFGSAIQKNDFNGLIVTVQNIGTAALIVANISRAGSNSGDFTLIGTDWFGTPIPSGGIQQFTVQFNPTVDGQVCQARLTVYSNAVNSADGTVGLTGTWEQPKISVTADKLDFGTFINKTDFTPVTVTVTNTGSGNLIVDRIANPAPDEFSISDDAWVGRNTRITSQQTRQFKVKFNPAKDGEERNVTLKIHSNAAAVEQDAITLTGTWEQPHIQIEVTPGADFGSLIDKSGFKPVTVKIKNAGSGNLIATEIAKDGTHAGDFTFTAPGWLNQPIAQGQEETFEVAFDPDSDDLSETNLEIRSNAINPGDGIVTLKGTWEQPKIEVTPKLDFGSLSEKGGFKPLTVTVKNVGSGNLIVTEIAKRGEGADDFAFTAPDWLNGPIGKGEERAFEIGFSPTTDGMRTNSLDITSNAVNEATVAVALNAEWFIPIQVTPTVNVEEGVGWYDDTDQAHFVSARMTVGLTENPKPSDYKGDGHLTVNGNITLYTDKACRNRAPASFSAEQLRETQPLYVKGGGIGQAKVELKLDPSADPLRIVVDGNPAEGAVEIKPVNVVTPKIEAEYKAVLLDKNLAQHQGNEVTKHRTGLTYVEVYLEESHRNDKSYDKGAFLKDASGKVEFFFDDACQNRYAPNTALPTGNLTGGNKQKLYLKGNTAGEFTLTLEPEDKKENDQSFRVVEKAELKMVVVQLDVELYRYAEAKPHAEAMLSDQEKVTEGRLLHLQNAGNFGRAKLIVKKPDDNLWSVGGADYKVVLNATAGTGGVRFYNSEAAGGPIGTGTKWELQQSDFGGGDKTVWVEGTSECDNLRDIRVDVGIDRPAGGLAKTPKANGDWARFTVVKINKVTPDTPNYKQKVNGTGGAADEGPIYRTRAELTKPLDGVKICFRLVADEPLAVTVATPARNATTLPEVWKHKNPDTPVSALTANGGIAEADVELSGVDPNYKSGYNGNKFRVAAYISGEKISDDPKEDDVAPTYRVQSLQKIEIEAPALPCPCCGQNPGHSTGYPMTMADWHRTIDFKTPTPTPSSEVAAYNTVMLDVAARVNNPPCSCSGGGTRVTPQHPCDRFSRPLADTEYQAIVTKWNRVRKRRQNALGIPTEAVVRGNLTASLGRPPTQDEVQNERQVNHLVPKAGGGCPTNVGNLQAHGNLCPYCRQIDEDFTDIQARLGRIAK